MVILIAGASHTGKTVLAQQLLEQLHYPYLSMDHLKMGLIRSGKTNLTVFDDDAMTEYLWPIVAEMVKTAIENGQNLIVEGCYIPYDWQDSFDGAYLEQIRYVCLVMSEDYIRNHFEAILHHANAVETRLDDSDLSREWLIEENLKALQACKVRGLPHVLIAESYDVADQLGGILCPT